ncbi:hypothetical protein J6590_001949 [Homalodisca vitripennis]|nr:hypothetical protein J6590_001949 [Homalodisca vitripennis]
MRADASGSGSGSHTSNGTLPLCHWHKTNSLFTATNLIGNPPRIPLCPFFYDISSTGNSATARGPCAPTPKSRMIFHTPLQFDIFCFAFRSRKICHRNELLRVIARTKGYGLTDDTT